MAWWGRVDMRDVYKQHPEDFLNGFDDAWISFDNESKQENAGWQVLEGIGFSLQQRRRQLPSYSPVLHRVSVTKCVPENRLLFPPGRKRALLCFPRRCKIN